MAHPMRRAWPALLALAVGGFAIGTTEFASMGLVPQIATSFGVSEAAAGHVIAAYALGVVVGAPALTILAARVERKRLLLLLMGLFVAGHLLSALATSMNLLLAARFLAGLPHGAFFGVGAVVGGAVAGPGNRAKAIGTMLAGLTIANMVGVPFATALGQEVGWQSMFLAVGVLGLLTLVAVWVMVPSGLVPPGRSAREEIGSLRNAPLWISFVASGIGFGGLFAVYTFIAPLVTDVGEMSERAVPPVMAVFGLGMTIGVLLAGRLADRGVLPTLISGMVATTIALVLLGLTGESAVMLVLWLFVLAIVSQVFAVAAQTRLMDLSPLAPSLGAALCHSALNLGNAEGAFLGGVVIEAGWGYLGTAWIGAILTVVGLVIVLAIGRQKVAEPALAERVREALADDSSDSQDHEVP